MTISATLKRLIWRPHNYRRGIEVKQKTNSTIKSIEVLFPKLTIGKHNKLLYIKDYQPNISIQYGKKILTAIYKQTIIGGHKETFVISRNSIKDVQDRIDHKKGKIQKKLDQALLKFSRQFKVHLPVAKPRWIRYEDFIKGDDYLECVPKECAIHDTIFKKVYKGRNLEFKSSKDFKEPTTHLKNFIKNMAIKDVSPEIAQEIAQFNYSTSKLLVQFSEQIRLHLGVLKDIKKAMNKFNDNLTQSKLKKWQHR